MVWGLATKATIEANVLKDRSPPFVQLSDGRVQNGYTLKLVNKLSEPRVMEVSIAGPDGLAFNVIGFELVGPGYKTLVDIARVTGGTYAIVQKGRLYGGAASLRFAKDEFDTEFDEFDF